MKRLIPIGLIPSALLALLVLAPVLLPASASPVAAATATTLPPGFTQQGPGQTCGAGTFAIFGVCAPCRYNPSQCSPPVQTPITPKAKAKNTEGTAASGDRKVPVSTISKKEAPEYGLGVTDKQSETHPACRVAGGPAYTFTPSQAAVGRCSTSANKYFDPDARCPEGTRRRTRGNSGEYWCDSNRNDYSINDRVKGHTVCMRGAIAILDNGSCLYCPSTSTDGRSLLRAASAQSKSCTYASASATTVRVSVPATPPPSSPPPVSSTQPPVSEPPPSTPIYVPPTAAPPTTPSTVPSSGPPSLPKVSPGWSPSVAVTQLPLYLWLKEADGTTFANPPTATWVDSQGRTKSTTMRATSSVWTFEVVDGAGKRKTETVTCSGSGAPWQATWVGADGQPTAAARADGACWYIYRHMGDGSARSVSVTIHWSVRTCQTLPTPKPCTTASRTSSFQSSISVTEIQALVT